MKSHGAIYETIDEEERLVDVIARAIADQKVVGHFFGPMEFGPRALGNRSILGDARSPSMQSVMNLKIKFRESFRPFAPAVLRERASEWFEMSADQESPYMLFTAPVRARRRRAVADEKDGLAKLDVVRSEIPAVTHVDYSARVQTVDRARNPRFHAILARFEELTGCPVVINTSFNVRGEPIVCTPEDALRCFMVTDMDVLVLDRFVLKKEAQPAAGATDRSRHLASFDLD